MPAIALEPVDLMRLRRFQIQTETASIMFQLIGMKILIAEQHFSHAAASPRFCDPALTQ
jgi:hypothetical protein